MKFEKSPPSPEEMAKIEKERDISDIELIRGGAEYKFEEAGKGVRMLGEELVVTNEQIEEKRKEMEKELESVDFKFDKLTADEQMVFLLKEKGARAIQTINSFMYGNKIDKKTRDELVDQIDLLRHEAIEPYREKIGHERTEAVSELFDEYTLKRLGEDISGAKSFDELFGIINRGWTFQGTEESFAPEKMKDIIDKVRKGKLDIRAVTRAEGLREQVTELLKIEKME